MRGPGVSSGSVLLCGEALGPRVRGLKIVCAEILLIEEGGASVSGTSPFYIQMDIYVQ